MGTGQLTCALWLAILGAPIAEQQSAPTSVSSDLVTIERRQFSENGTIGTIEVDLLNKTQVGLTAWLVAVNYTLSNGDKRTSGIMRDEYDAHLYPQPPDGDAGPVSPGVLRREAIMVVVPMGVEIEAVSAGLAMVAFEDDTWSGDALSAKYLFEKRAREARVWGAIAEAMRQGSDVGGQTGLKKVLAHLEQSTSADRQDTAVQSVRQNLERAIASTLNVNPDDFLRRWLQRAVQGQEVAAAHLHPRGIRSGRQ